jgi:hypothetical protein
LIGQIHFSDCRRNKTLKYVKNFKTYCKFLISLTSILFWYIHRNRLLVFLKCSFGSYKNFWLQLMPRSMDTIVFIAVWKDAASAMIFPIILYWFCYFFKVNLFPLSKSTSVILSNFRRPEQNDSCQFVNVQFFVNFVGKVIIKSLLCHYCETQIAKNPILVENFTSFVDGNKWHHLEEMEQR